MRTDVLLTVEMLCGINNKSNGIRNTRLIFLSRTKKINPAIRTVIAERDMAPPRDAIAAYGASACEYATLAQPNPPNGNLFRTSSSATNSKGYAAIPHRPTSESGKYNRDRPKDKIIHGVDPTKVLVQWSKTALKLNAKMKTDSTLRLVLSIAYM
jgi:hypothetical protein